MIARRSAVHLLFLMANQMKIYNAVVPPTPDALPWCKPNASKEENIVCRLAAIQPQIG